MRYKYKLPTHVKETVEWHLEHYKEDKRQLELIKKEMLPSNTPNYGACGGGGSGVSNPTECAFFKIESNLYLANLERVCNAIDRALKKFDEIDMRLIKIIYWQRSHNALGAGVEIGLEKTSVYDRLNRILGVTALEIGLIDIPK